MRLSRRVSGNEILPSLSLLFWQLPTSGLLSPLLSFPPTFQVGNHSFPSLVTGLRWRVTGMRWCRFRYTNSWFTDGCGERLSGVSFCAVC